MEKALLLVKRICSMQSSNCRSLNKTELARELMDLANIPKTAIIQEIPLDWDNQVVVMFLMPKDNNYYSLFCGIDTDNKYNFELTIDGTLKGTEFDFYEEPKKLSINHFVNENYISKRKGD